MILDFRKSGPLSYIALAALFLLTMPTIYQNVIAYRQWDQPYAAAMLAAAWLVVEQACGRQPSHNDIVVLALLTVVASFFSVAVIPAIIVAGWIVIWRMSGKRQRFIASALGAAIIVAGLLPWGFRNEIMLNKFILTR